jgi:DNA-binding MarR family transcriptional regulator
MRSLAERIGRDKLTVTTLVDKLIKLCYVKKARGEVLQEIYHERGRRAGSSSRTTTNAPKRQ